jgi:hypothetical protein
LNEDIKSAVPITRKYTEFWEKIAQLWSIRKFIEVVEEVEAKFLDLRLDPKEGDEVLVENEARIKAPELECREFEYHSTIVDTRVWFESQIAEPGHFPKCACSKGGICRGKVVRYVVIKIDMKFYDMTAASRRGMNLTAKLDKRFEIIDRDVGVHSRSASRCKKRHNRESTHRSQVELICARIAYHNSGGS